MMSSQKTFFKENKLSSFCLYSLLSQMNFHCSCALCLLKTCFSENYLRHSKVFHYISFVCFDLRYLSHVIEFQNVKMNVFQLDQNMFELWAEDWNQLRGGDGRGGGLKYPPPNQGLTLARTSKIDLVTFIN